MKNICGKQEDHNIKLNYYPISEDLSSAYELYKENNLRTKTILFLHPGMHSDFSPRWDNLLFALVNSGFTVIAPNYPMSFGYGKSYQQYFVETAADDIFNWVKKLNMDSNEIFLLSMSSGNLILEEVLQYQDLEVSSMASIGGLRGRTSKNDKQRPFLRLYGSNDPLLNYSELVKQKVIGDSIFIFQNEGHWFRDINNQYKSFLMIKEWF